MKIRISNNGGKKVKLTMIASASIAVIILILMTLFGCGEIKARPTTIVKVISPTEEMPGETSDPHLKKAQEMMDGVRERRAAVQEEAEKKGDFSGTLKASDMIFEEELGLKKMFIDNLIEVYLQNTPKTQEKTLKLLKLQKLLMEKGELINDFYLEFISYYDDILTEYLRISFEHPNENKEGLLKIFAKSMAEGAININFPNFL